MTEENTFLYEGLPCILFKNKYIIFSPYSSKIATLTKREISEKTTKEKLRKNNFFGKPKSDTYGKDTARLTLITTTDCNLRCIYCFAKSGENPTYMDPNLAIRSIQEVIKPDTHKFYLSFFGGEPTLNFECIKKAVNYSNDIEIPTKYQITTNGVMDDNVLDFLIKNNFIFYISIDGTPDIQNTQRPMIGGQKSYSHVLKTIRKLVDNNISIKFRVTATKFNVNKLGNVVKHLHELGAKYVHIEPLHLAGRAYVKKSLQPTAEEFIKNFKNALNVAEKYNIKLINTAYLFISNPCTVFCSSLQGKKFTVTPDGRVTFCLETQDEYHPLATHFILGKFNKKKNKFEYKKHKLSLLKCYSVEKIKKCERCFAKYICSGGCPIRNMMETGKPNEPNEYFCKIKKAILYDVIVRIWKNSQKKKLYLPY